MLTNNLLVKELMKRPYIASKIKELTQDDEFYYFYKHTRVDPQKLVLNIFEKCHIKFTKPVDFNDPYDCHFDTRVDFSGLTRKKFNKEHNLKIREYEWEESKEKYKNHLIKIIKKHALKDFRENFFTVTCFNNNPLNILMWSHYADNHKGFLIEFKIPKYDFGRLPLPVEYSHEYPTISLPYSFHAYEKDINIQIENTRKIFYIKSKEWEYENEYRLINVEKELSSFPANYISSVLFGTNTPASIKNAINEVIKNFNLKHSLDVKTYQAQLAQKQYRLTAPGHPRLDKL